MEASSLTNVSKLMNNLYYRKFLNNIPASNGNTKPTCDFHDDKIDNDNSMIKITQLESKIVDFINKIY